MKVSFDQWMKNPAKWMKKTTEYHKNMRDARERLEQWSKTPQGQQRIKEYLLKQGYTLDENGNWTRNNKIDESPQA